MKHLFGAVLALLLCATSAFAGVCADPSVPKLSAAINVGSATTSALIPAVTSARIYVCQFMGSLAGTTPSAIFKYGTKASTDCDTGAVSMSGTILPLTGTTVMAGYGDDLMVTPPSQQLCVTTAGTNPSFQGVITYVQK